MPSIDSSRDASLLQLQYLTDMLGMHRTYVDDDMNLDKEPAMNIIPKVAHLENLIKPTPTPKLAEIINRPDIEWHPSYDIYQARVARLAKSALERPTTVPPGFPARVSSPRVWTGSDFGDPDKYLLHFSASDIAEIKAALTHFKSLDGDNSPDAVSTETFPLPTLRDRLGALARNIHLGTGFNVLRGLDPRDFSPLDNVLIYLGITSYIAPIRGCQDYDGRMIVHIKDIEKDLPEATGRPSPYTNRAQPFHTDMCDILAMYVLDTAMVGGQSLLASSGMIYNELAATRPDLIHLLADDQWIHDNFNKREETWTNRPLLFNFNKHGPGFCYSRRPLTGAPFSPHGKTVPAMTEEQAEAIDAVHFAAVKHQLVINLQAGDIEIFNNMALFHARNAFTDSDAPEARTTVQDSSGDCQVTRELNGTRHMLRLWLRSDDDELVWETPEPLEHTSNEIYGDHPARKIAKWHVHRAPPINRILITHFQCS